MAGIEDAIADLKAEHDEIDRLLTDLRDEQWSLTTTPEGWDIRDQVSHLADTNEICVDTVLGGPRPLNEYAKEFSSPDALTESGCERGRAMTPQQVLAWFRDSASGVRAALTECDPGVRINWGLGMSARMMVTARLMEHWAHHYDIRRALGLGPSISPRLKSIAFLSLRAVPYALGYAQAQQPPGTLRATLTFGDETWELGPADADNAVTGDALEFCLLGVRRATRDETSLKAEGPLAEAALDNLRAFL
ncbi:MAG TPA: maleylpyruvate isomerase family mycothiol-dependent enzyme [Actinomycetota bacterium]